MFELPKLPYAYDALEPYIDARTMELHHSKHHQTYVTKLNEAIEKHPELSNKTLEQLLTEINTIPEDIRVAVRNHGGGHFNHSLFWKLMISEKQRMMEPKGQLGEAISKSFGSFTKFKENLSKAALGVFGSGWVWLVTEKEGLKIITTPNQDSPIMNKLKPILGLDVWEHAYYLKYQNRRPDYIESWWNVVNWQEVESSFEST